MTPMVEQSRRASAWQPVFDISLKSRCLPWKGISKEIITGIYGRSPQPEVLQVPSWAKEIRDHHDPGTLFCSSLDSHLLIICSSLASSIGPALVGTAYFSLGWVNKWISGWENEWSLLNQYLQDHLLSSRCLVIISPRCFKFILSQIPTHLAPPPIPANCSLGALGLWRHLWLPELFFLTFFIYNTPSANVTSLRCLP